MESKPIPPQTSSVSRNRGTGYAWIAAVCFALIGGYFLLRPFWGVIIFAAVAAYLSNSLYQWFVRTFRGHKSWAVGSTAFLATVVVGVPVMFILVALVAQATSLARSVDINHFTIGNTSMTTVIEQEVHRANHLLEGVTKNPATISTDKVLNSIKGYLPTALRNIANLVLNVASSIPSFFVAFVLFAFIYIGLLLGQDKLLATVRGLLPFERRVGDLYLRRIGAMTKAMVKGQLLIAFVQGLIGAGSLALLGLGKYFLIFALIFTILSLIPLGSGIVLIPVGILAMFFGHIWEGIGILAIHFIITSNVDNLLRPRLVPKDAHLPASLTILSALAGVHHFGILGVIYGPILMIIITTTFESYLQYKRSGAAVRTAAESE